MITLTIITINLNNLQGLKKTISSIYFGSHLPINQINHIVIDGCSSDGSSEYLYENKFLGYELIVEKDGGIFNAMNKGISMAKGDYIIFMNSGDAFCQGVLTENFIQDLGGYDLVYGNFYSESKGFETKCNQTKSLDFFYFLGKTICHQSVFLKTELCKKYFFIESPEYSLMGDWIQLFTILKCEKPKIKYCESFICIYNSEGQSEMYQSKRLEQRSNYLKSLYSEWELNDMLNISRLRNRSYYKIVINSLDKYLLAKFFNLLSKIICR